MTTARPQYRFAENAVGNTSNEYGNHILKRGCGEIRKPSWNRTETVVRFLPQFNFEANQWEPFRRSPAPMDFGDWIRRYDAVRGFGETGITMLLYDPITNPAYDIQSNPCVILYRAINAAIDNRQCEPDWPALLKGGNNRRATLGRHGHVYLARCGVFRIKSKDMATGDRSPLGLANSDSAFFLELPKTAGEKLIASLEERNEDFQGDPEDYKNYYKHGDIVSLDAGAYVHIFEEGSDPRANTYQQGSAPRQLQVGSGGRGNYSGGGGGGSQFKGYDMFISQDWNGYAPQLNTPDLERLIKSKQRPWEDCVQFYNHQEQAHLVQDGFPASAILYAWRDHPEWIKDETRSKAVSRTSVSTDVRVQTPTDIARGAGNVMLQSAPPVVVPARTTTVSSAPAEAPAGNVGGWGEKGWEATAGKDEIMQPARDNVVPTELPAAVTTTTVADNALPTAGREEKARQALEAARARARS